MKILHLVTTSESSHFQERLRFLKSKNIEYDVLATTPNRNKKDKFSFYSNLVEGIEGNPYFFLKAIPFFPRVLKKTIASSDNGYDLVHVNCGLVAPFALAQPIRPIVITFWGSDLLRDFFGGYNRGILRYCAKHADENIVMSEEMKEALGYDTHVIPDGVDLEKFKPIQQDVALERVGWNPEKKHVLFPYPPERTVKRYWLAKKTVEKANQKINEEIVLHIIKGEPHSKIPFFMNAADVLLLTSKSEGSPNTVKEALACNTSVVSTDVGDVRELVEGVKYSMVCSRKKDLVEGILYSLDESDNSDGRKRIKELGLGLEDVGRKILNVYQKAL